MLYRHYKGGLYRVLVDPCFHTETQEELVIYMSVETGKVWARPTGTFYGLVDLVNGVTVPRFVEVSE